MRMKEMSLWGWMLSCALVCLCMGWRRRQQLTHSTNTQIIGTSREKNSAVTFSFSSPPKGCRECLNMKRDRSGLTFCLFWKEVWGGPAFPYRWVVIHYQHLKTRQLLSYRVNTFLPLPPSMPSAFPPFFIPCAENLLQIIFLLTYIKW